MRCHKSIAYLCAAVLISITSAACKPKPVDTDSAAESEVRSKHSAPNHSASVDDASARGSVTGDQHHADDSRGHNHVHSDNNSDINAVADKIDPAVKADLARLIEERSQAKPQVESLPSGGERVQLNGSHSAIAVAVANEDGEVTIYHHGENYKPRQEDSTSAAQGNKSPANIETVKPYPQVKKITAPAATHN